MEQPYSWPWVQTHVEQTIEVWNRGATGVLQPGRRYRPREQQKRERAFDAGLRTLEREARRSPRSRADRIETQHRIAASFARCSATALDLDTQAVHLAIGDFLPVGTNLARWARRFDPRICMADILQACRNAWTAGALQSLLGERVEITPSILAYSLLYPYSDNYLDRGDLSAQAKLRFSARFRDRLLGNPLSALHDPEPAVWKLVELIEEQYPRARYPQVYDCLLAIHRAQEESIAQLRTFSPVRQADVLRISCAKGGASVLADACLAQPRLRQEESRFAFEWGVLLQLGDDLQDLRDDLRRGSTTLFSHAAALGVPLDRLVVQLLNFSDRVGSRMDRLPNGSATMKQLFKASWRSLIVAAVADAYQFFSPEFITEAEACSPFRFRFLRSRQEKWNGRQALHGILFDAFMEHPDGEDGELPLPQNGNTCFPPLSLNPVAEASPLG